MIPDPSTAETPFVEDGPDRPAPGPSHDDPGAGHHLCVACGQAIAANLWDMTVFAGYDRVAYITCLFELMAP